MTKPCPSSERTHGGGPKRNACPCKIHRFVLVLPLLAMLACREEPAPQVRPYFHPTPGREYASHAMRQAGVGAGLERPYKCGDPWRLCTGTATTGWAEAMFPAGAWWETDEPSEPDQEYSVTVEPAKGFPGAVWIKIEKHTGTIQRCVLVEVP